jgi:amino acid transporter
LIIAAGNICNFWNLSYAWKSAIFVLLPTVIFLINTRSVLFFGNIELAGGTLKVILVLGIFILMVCLDQGLGPGEKIGALYFNDGVRNNPNVADSHLKACLIGISLAVFPYIGIESITVTAFEAKSPQKSLRFAAKNLAYLVTALYLISVVAFTLNVEWFNQSLARYFDQNRVDAKTNPSLGHTPSIYYDLDSSPVRSESLPVIAIQQAGMKFLPGFCTACLVYSALSAANSALYIASRTMYGLAQSLDPESRSAPVRVLSRIGTVTPDTRVPGWALVLSCFFVWLPFLPLGVGYTRGELQQILISIGSTSCVLVWASQCLAFIRYHGWRKMHKDYLREGRYLKYHPTLNPGFHSWFAYWQPLPAWIGLIGCILIVLVFASVGMYNDHQLRLKALVIYLGPALLLCMFVLLKLINRRKWVVRGDWPSLRTTLIGLEDRELQPSGINGADNVSDDGVSGHFSTTDVGAADVDVAHQFENFSQEGRFEMMQAQPAPVAHDQPYPTGGLYVPQAQSGSGSRDTSMNNHSGERRSHAEEGYASDGSGQPLRPNARADAYPSVSSAGQPMHYMAYGNEHGRGPSYGSSELGT